MSVDERQNHERQSLMVIGEFYTEAHKYIRELMLMKR